jgi:hypothetical protein
MRIKKSFVIRWLKTLDSNRNEVSIIDVEHVQTGDLWRVSSIEEAAETMKSAGNNASDQERIEN